MIIKDSQPYWQNHIKTWEQGDHSQTKYCKKGTAYAVHSLRDGKADC